MPMLVNSEMTARLLTLQDVHKSYAGQPILSGISMDVTAGQVVVLLGPSGCGKTTLLRIIAGLEKIDSGRLLLNGLDLTEIPVHLRRFGLVFQEFALFPHKSVFENVAFGLRMSGWEKEQRVDRVDQMLTLVGLAGFGDRPVHELSGGEQQRVALARSLAPAPRLLLLDEPLGSLDRALRERLLSELRGMLKEAGQIAGLDQPITAVYVTHDQAEAFALADQVVVLNAGRVEQIGRPRELYLQPRTPFVARFLGMTNLVAGLWQSHEPPAVRTLLGEFELAAVPSRELEPGQPVTLLIRPDAARLREPGVPAVNVISGQLTKRSFRGRYQVIELALPAGLETISLTLELESDLPLPTPPAGLELVLDHGRLTVLE
jgi:ABC-type Fe3+/spermidine/putrescine transport system ATPase subunit